jgi:hypothetical protein
LQEKVALVSTEGIHQLHIFVFVLAVFHVLYCVTTLALGKAKVYFDLKSLFFFLFWSLGQTETRARAWIKTVWFADEKVEGVGNGNEDSWLSVLTW